MCMVKFSLDESYFRKHLPVVKPIKAFSPPSKPVIHQALTGPSFLAGTPPEENNWNTFNLH